MLIQHKISNTNVRRYSVHVEWRILTDMLAQHAFERINMRLNDPVQSNNLFTIASAMARHIKANPCNKHECKGHAIRLYTDTKNNGSWTFNTDGSGDSNGNVLYAIIRNGNLVTIMWRREIQPATCNALRVSHIGKVSVK